MARKQPDPPPTVGRPAPPPGPPKPGVSTLWVCGKMRGKDDGGNVAWDLQGVFNSEERAEAACRESHDFIGPVVLNQALPQGATEWPNCRYPLAQ